MRITEEELQRRLDSQNNLVSQLKAPASPRVSAPIPSDPPSHVPHVDHRTKHLPHRGATLPEAVRDTIGTLSRAGAGTNIEIGAAFGISRQTVSYAATGKVGGKPANDERKAKIEDQMSLIKDAALRKLMLTLNLMDDDKLAELKATELSRVSRDMATVAGAFEDRTSIGVQANVIVYAPERRSEDGFKVVDV